VILTLTPDPDYVIGSPSAATVTIEDDPAVVTVLATDADAAEAGLDPGVFTFTRSGGNIDAALTMFVRATGTARNGTDYESVGGGTFAVTFPAGSAAATVTIVPIDDAVVEAPETAIFTITDLPSYVVGAPSEATVTITSDE
jgi:hypothetical protein